MPFTNNPRHQPRRCSGSTPWNKGAGDQGMMFGYACNETDNYMPLSLELSHLLLYELATNPQRRSGNDLFASGPKSQVTIEYGDDNKPARIHTIVISTQHDEFVKATASTPKHNWKLTLKWWIKYAGTSLIFCYRE